MVIVNDTSRPSSVSLRDVRLELGARPFDEHLAAVRADNQERIAHARRRRQVRGGTPAQSDQRPQGTRGLVFDAVGETLGIDQAVYRGRHLLRRIEAAASEGDLPRVIELLDGADQALAALPTLTWLVRETLTAAEAHAAEDTRGLNYYRTIVRAITQDERFALTRRGG